MIKLHAKKVSTDYNRATWFSFLSSMKIAYIPFLFLNTGGMYYYRGWQDIRTERMTFSSFNIIFVVMYINSDHCLGKLGRKQA